jgi:hypothetical protein
MPSRLLLLLIVCFVAHAADFWVGPQGKDANPGTKARPFATFVAAQRAVAQRKGSGPATVHFLAGTYYLPQTVAFTDKDSGSKDSPITYMADEGAEAVISGGTRLSLQWKPWRGDIMQASVPAGMESDQLFVNGERQHMARYPNVDPAAQYFDGWAADAFSKERAARWADPSGGFIHAMHLHMWGDYHYAITGKDADGNVRYQGGWQNNRQMGMHDKYRFVENIFEELDAPGEWYLDRKTSTLYFYPPKGLDLPHATVEAVRLRHLIEFRGTAERPVKWVNLKGFTFRHAARTFMDNKEPLLRSDWTTYRGGALFLTGAEDVTIENCFIDQVGGNAIFVNMYNRRIVVRGVHIARAGSNGVAFVGDPKAVRNPLFEYGQTQSVKNIDLKPGPQTDNYPSDSRVEDSLIYLSGRVEKQTAPVQISMASRITVSHCSIYDTPRAGINISEGTWGGHVIEYSDIFDTVKETGDHGSFNSWGRDRYWNLKDVDLNTVTLGEQRNLPLLDVVEPNIIRNNRWRCDHGWDVDLDDGSSNYRIYNNLFLNGGLKLREGFYRTVENNIMVNNSFHPHVWYGNSQDTFHSNILFTVYQPIRVGKPWGKECDLNLLHRPGKTDSTPALFLQAQSGLDQHSIEADALFVNPAVGDYRVKDGSPALKLGFQNFPMDQFGVRKPALKAIARTPKLPGADDRNVTLAPGRDKATRVWAGATVRNVSGLGEVSAYGLPGEVGVLVVDAPAGSAAAAAGLRKDDVIFLVNGNTVASLPELLRSARGQTATTKIKVGVFRSQRVAELEIAGPLQ